jgi:hypothetical protein
LLCQTQKATKGREFLRQGSLYIGNFLGLQSAPIPFESSGPKWSVTASNIVDMAAEAARGINPASAEPLYLENTGHPAADRFALADASRSHVHAFGMDWDDVTGRNNGQYAPFSWAGA